MSWKSVSLFIVLTLHAWAGNLQWETTRFDALANAEDAKLETIFRFKNIGSQPVAIAQVIPSCGCTVAKPDKSIYAAGEEGTIRVVYDFEGRVGRQEKTIEVVTSDAQKPTTLVLNVTIAETFTIKPRILLWKVASEELTTKTALLVANRNVPLNPIEAKCDNPNFKTQLVPLVPGQQWELQVTPKSTAQAMKASVNVVIETLHGSRTVNLYAVVQ